MNTNNIVEILEAGQPQFHWGGARNWNAAPETLREIQRSVSKGMHTLETGCGASTVVFASSGANHTVISPTHDEHQRVVDYLRENDIETTHLTFEAGFSDDVLPKICDYPERMKEWDAWFARYVKEATPAKLKSGEIKLWTESNERHLDFIFLDGAHSFPYPIIDWHYSIRALKIGGRLLLDDIPIPAVACVYRYMTTDPSWKLINILDNRAAVFELVSSPIPEDSRLQFYNRHYDYGFLPLYKRGYMHLLDEVQRVKPLLGEKLPLLRDAWRRLHPHP
jgi:hypothetical protein